MVVSLLICNLNPQAYGFNDSDIPPHMDQNILTTLNQNTFIFIPINHYASVISKQSAEEFVQTNCHLNHLPPNEVLNCKALADCEGNQCIREYQNHGTSFLLGDGKTLFTAWHVAFPTHATPLYFFKNYALTLTHEDRYNLFSVFKPKFILLDHDYNIVYDSRHETKTRYLNYGDPLSTIFAKEGHIHSKAYGYFANIPEDFVSIELSYPLGNGLKLQTEPNTDTKQQFLTTGFGYDSVNFNFQINAGYSQKLVDLKSNSGLFIDFLLNPLPLNPEELLQLPLLEQLMLMGYSEESSLAQISKYGEALIASSIAITLASHARHQDDFDIEQHKHVLFLENPVLPGQSGGPVLNLQGQVVGIITTSILDQDAETNLMISHGSGVYLFKPKL